MTIYTYKLKLTIDLATYLLKHLCGGTKVYFRVCLLCILYSIGLCAGH